MVAKVKITQIKSTIGAKQNMKDTLRILGLRKIGQSIAHESTDTVFDVVRTVHHLVTVEEVD